MGQVSTLWDFVLFPFYIILIYFLAHRFRNSHYPQGHPWRMYFLPALTCKIIGATVLCLIYQYYYTTGGDTILYFKHSLIINESFNESIVKWFNLLLRIPPAYSGEYSDYISRLFWYYAPNNYIVGSVGAIFGIFTFNTYLNSSLLFAVFSFTGIWAMFRCFARQFPNLTRQAAISTLFIPTLFFWGSGFTKDAICVFGFGWMVYIVFNLFLQGSLKLSNILLLILSVYLLFVTKIYILIAFMPALAFWILSLYSVRIKNRLIANFTRYTLIALLVAYIPILNNQFKEELGNYSLDNILNTSTTLQNSMAFYAEVEESSSSYSLGITDFTPLGIIKSIPAAVNVTLYRPYVWEVKKPIVLMSALESLLYLITTLVIVFSIGPVKVLKIIFTDVNVQFMLIFTLIFAFAIGISTLNFGTLSRYKIPCMPTFAMALFLIYYHDGDYKKRILFL